ncbi:MAG: phenylacetate--CoA ligase family protein [Allosphingosinicella sp.]
MTAAALAAEIGRLKASERLSPEAHAERQLAALADVALHCAAHSPYFRRRLDSAGLAPAELGSPAGLAALPPVDRRAFQSAPDLFCTAVPESDRPVRAATTSGSTGEPVTVRRTALNRLHWLAITMRDHLWHRRDFSGRLAAIRANVPRLTRQPDWGPPASLLYTTGEALGLPVDTPIGQQLELLLDFRPMHLITYPGALAALAERVAATGLRLDGLKTIRTVAETLKPETRAAAEAALGAPVADAYSSQEVGYLALQCPDGPDYHVMAETVLVEVLDAGSRPCAEGEVGRVVVSDLHNRATPLIRYEIGDFAEVGGACPCGRGLPTLRRILGRERNLIRMPDGSRRWPLVGFHGFREIAPILQFQLIQREAERIEVRLVAGRAVTVAEEAGLRDRIQCALGHPFALDMIWFDARLPAGPGGKFEEFMCLV